MRISAFGLCLFIICFQTVNSQGRIGINTNTPQAILHVKDSSVLFSITSLPVSPGNPPASGAGARMMWYSPKAAFRVGDPNGTSWNRDSIGNYSFATGYATMAKGTNSIAGGENSEATGQSSIALGTNVTSSGFYSVGIGRQIQSTNNASVAMGYGCTAQGLASTAMGYFNTADGSYSAALGFSTVSTGQMSLATGYDTNAEGVVSISSGYRCTSPGSYSIAGGFQTVSVPYASIAIGRYNVDTMGNSDMWVSTDPVFTIGNGSDGLNRSNAFTVLKNGKTAINGHLPAAALSIKGIDGTEFNHLELIDNNTIESARIYYTGNLIFKNSLASGDYFFKNSANTNLLNIANTGNVTVAGTLTQNSDARLKKDFQPLRYSLQKVTELKAYQYYWKDQGRDSSVQTGFTAQDVELIMPELVKTSDEGIKSINYSGIIPYLAEAIKELKEQNEQLKKEIQHLKKK